MSSIPGISAYSQIGETNPRVPVRSLTQDDFLKLLTTQMSSQDPMNPMKDADFIAQMAQFSALEQAKALGEDVSQLNAQQQFAQAASLLGRTVQVQAGGAVVSGVVTAMQMNAGAPQVVVGGEFYDLSQIFGVSTTPLLP